MVLQHYTQSLQNEEGTSNHKILDISTFIQYYLKTVKIEIYLQNGNGELGYKDFFMIIGILQDGIEHYQPPLKSNITEENFYIPFPY